MKTQRRRGNNKAGSKRHKKSSSRKQKGGAVFLNHTQILELQKTIQDYENTDVDIDEFKKTINDILNSRNVIKDVKDANSKAFFNEIKTKFENLTQNESANANLKIGYGVLKNYYENVLEKNLREEVAVEVSEIVQETGIRLILNFYEKISYISAYNDSNYKQFSCIKPFSNQKPSILNASTNCKKDFFLPVLDEFILALMGNIAKSGNDHLYGILKRQYNGKFPTTDRKFILVRQYFTNKASNIFSGTKDIPSNKYERIAVSFPLIKEGETGDVTDIDTRHVKYAYHNENQTIGTGWKTYSEGSDAAVVFDKLAQVFKEAGIQ